MLIPSISRLDSGQNFFLARELENIETTEYPVIFAGVLWSKFVPRATDVAPYESVHTYRMFEVQGRAKVGAPNATDQNQVNIVRSEFSRNVVEIPGEFEWGIREIQAAAAKNLPLDRLLPQAAMSVIARKIDRMVALGDGTSKITGILNHPDVADSGTGLTPTTKTGGGTSWLNGTATPTEILTDINSIVTTTWARLQQATSWPGGDGTPMFDKFIVLLPLKHWALIASTPRSINSDTTILKYALDNNPMIEAIEPWWHCDTADADHSDGPLMACYPRDPKAVSAVVPLEYQQQAPQESGLKVVTPCYGTCGGTIFRYTVAASYMKQI